MFYGEKFLLFNAMIDFFVIKQQLFRNQ